MNKNKERAKGAIFGAVVVAAISVIAVPILARVAQETITVNFNDISIAVDGETLHLEYEPFIFNGRTYLPVRSFSEALGFEVTFDDATNTVHLTSAVPEIIEETVNLNVVPNYPAHQSNITIPTNIVPRAAARSGAPTNPAITAQRAVEMARDHLIEIGVATARFDYIYMDLERGDWVWSVEFDGQGRSFEFYIDVNTGVFVQAPQMVNSNIPQTTQATQPQMQTQSNRPTNPNISREQAIEIAYAHLAQQGINATFRSHSGMNLERGQWVWELLFRTSGERMPFIEFYISVDDGSIVKMEWDD
ncbi:MAG: PepSY domain-containing protein [Defluviitaleaceae bacterium]|nr:PepSY domain-containing protein [Defluviitaleaceae bacterium]